ncbi:ABC transporter substrate-binding protein [Saccharopolyspora flava]|uniref:ABC-type nitrate/sulfonate/bicarbonate transport system, substrate-binding protein n=1 Tax=Saccharopolyspora flava TaxID=95161 RepID=A0A1I6SZT6_9PSEU|nr:ABC transporter substrate-binding protein [Saccharopolyspora flava]SFS82348.1 ABC-type nitrate/sulfonate/bicarbonate transport system, substrate-binding protein [Saccharopolyspora flava]
MPSSTRRALARRDFLRFGLSAVPAATVLSGCATSSAAPRETTVVRYQGSSGQVTFPELAADLGLLGDLRLEWIGNTTSGPQDIQATVTGDVDIGGAFNGSILRLVAAGAPIRAVVSYYGSDALTNAGYFVLDDSPVRGPADLRGASVGMNTVGVHHQDVLGIYLRRNGFTDAEVRDVQPVVVPPVSSEQALRSGQLDVSTMTGAIAEKAQDHGGIRPLFTDFQLLGAFSAGCYVLREDFIAANPTTTRALVGGIAQAVRWTQTRPYPEVVARFSDIIRRRGRNEDTTTAGYWRSSGIAGPGGVIAEREFSIWLQRLVETGVIEPGAVDVSRTYTNAFNPFARP